MPELVNCRVCGHEISTSARSCPNCGDTISLKEKLSEKIDSSGIKSGVKDASETFVGFLKSLWIVGISILIIWGLISLVTSINELM